MKDAFVLIHIPKTFCLQRSFLFRSKKDWRNSCLLKSWRVTVLVIYDNHVALLSLFQIKVCIKWNNSISQCEIYRLMTDPWLFLHMVFIVVCKESSSSFSDRIQFLELEDGFCAACRKLQCFVFRLHLLWLENFLSVECFLAFWVNASYTVFPRGVLPNAQWTAPILWGDLLMSSPFSTAATFFFFHSGRIPASCLSLDILSAFLLGYFLGWLNLCGPCFCCQPCFSTPLNLWVLSSASYCSTVSLS